MNNDSFDTTNLFTIKDRLSIEPHRMWINQPSTLQVLHRYHGMNVITMPNKPDDGKDFIRVYFTSGDIISMDMPLNALSKGWK